MVIKLIISIIILVVVAFFTGFNLDNKCNVNLLFKTFENVPVVISIMFSFAVGMACSLPFALIHRTKKSKHNRFEDEAQKTPEKPKKTLFGKKNKVEPVSEEKNKTENQSEKTTETTSAAADATVPETGISK